jgi:hypothetical protein
MMRLLRSGVNDEFSLVEYHDPRDIPQYGILSHTWGRDNEEVSFADLVNGTGRDKLGYAKLILCGKQAAKDGLEYFWVDTCCIDKTSSAELSEAINSMFRWYHHATKCYALLSDVSTTVPDSDTLSADVRASIRRSRWFTRSWTLQELLAPTAVEFLSVEGERLGDRAGLLQELHDVTRIPTQALQGHPLSQFDIEERLSWGDRRHAKREEDEAYSLLGIFDVCMPLIYGEGRENAFRRLRREIEQSQDQEMLGREEKKRRNVNDTARYHNDGSGSSFNCFGGNQNNNTGGGNQLIGTFNGPMRFG